MRFKHLAIWTLIVLGLGGGVYAKAEKRKLEQKLQALRARQTIDLVWGTSRWQIKTSDVGVEYDRRATLALDENRLTEKIASISAQIDIPAREPEVSIKSGKVGISLGENGQEVDERGLMQKIRQSLVKTVGEEIEIPVRQLLPKITPEQAELLRQRAEKLTGKSVVVKSDGDSWKIDSDQIVIWLEVGGWKRLEIEPWVATLAAGIDRLPQNAHFRYVNGRVEEFAPAKNGVVVKQGELVSLLVGYLVSLEKDEQKEIVVEIPTIAAEPAIKTGQVNTLGIKELIGRGQSNFAGSIANRIFNLKKAAGNMNGILVAPGETFSFNKYVGDISAAGGYRQAYVIKEGRTVLGDGGGICQVSTTLFRAILAAGLPIEERTAHAYRVHFYEEDSQPGFDATIFTPDVDLKFKNDTPAYILIQTIVDESKSKLVFELYGTSDGRKVEISKARVWDVTPPPPALYQDDPSLRSGQVRQVDWAAWGAKAAFDWKVTRGSEVLQQRTFYSVYRPWQAVYLRGTAR
ncbi:MAG: VanW family protein [Candidatus Amesbacteria bacterium GW2011_GWA2_47_11b]|uniref:VanW family protein n=3 Tax=Candidatus Amesiibacteriota TaxID=1752730 RepID=A0A0G1SI66_9BACT|nr:MAG: VanW family protein [Microgenomates group bacterium GW2011_GWC1_46_20]KKU58071.1 MAG: VanW family protein [Candidatus Amesbacteria bacterium GW2011_GWA2_47_11b]KKU69122.1 MAG: VanW family protein [Candidatus Amesbacteria bacterium GW2011_GWA1_47_20]KKU84028.1 MAG: VanW family protein [Candidatus Amesbacteria bacterium GW2011_GWC2_47_8]